MINFHKTHNKYHQQGHNRNTERDFGSFFPNNLGFYFLKLNSSLEFDNIKGQNQPLKIHNFKNINQKIVGGSNFVYVNQFK